MTDTRWERTCYVVTIDSKIRRFRRTVVSAVRYLPLKQMLNLSRNCLPLEKKLYPNNVQLPFLLTIFLNLYQSPVIHPLKYQSMLSIAHKALRRHIKMKLFQSTKLIRSRQEKFCLLAIPVYIEWMLTLFWTGSGSTLYWTGGGQKSPPQVNSAIWCLTTMKLGRNTV